MSQNSMRDSTIIFGVDPGSQVTGYGLIRLQGPSYQVIDYGCIRPPLRHKISDRYVIIYDALNHLFDLHMPKSLALETQYVHKNPQSTIALVQLRGIILIAAKKRGIEVFEYAPSQAKLAVVGYGQASKQQVQGMTQRLLGLVADKIPDDATDALALAICHAHSVTSNRPGRQL
ncbi:MAG: ruvC [Chlamydiales bacterium]|jgi:crossover junction endodeoxyribonuclease RuvC|nr:ruvC [Chlamydiales bacterium]